MAGTTTYYGISYPTSTDYVKDGATAMQTIATGFDSAVAIPTYNNQTGTSYTFVLADTGKTVTSDNASAVTFTIPPQSSVAWAANTTLTVRNLGAGVVTIAGGAGVTVTNTAQTVAQYGEVKLIRTASNAWTVVPASGGASGLTLVTSTTIGTAVSSVTVSNCFSSTYDHYLIKLTGLAGSQQASLAIQFNNSTGSTYKRNGYYQSYTAALTSGGGDVATGQTTTWIGMMNTVFAAFTAQIYSPFLTSRTATNSQWVTDNESGIWNGYDTNSVSNTGFTLSSTAGTMTGGTIKVYGFAN